ncbi:hypothetical protein IWT25_01358 [Secundilactobacillus pentosiphilus]|uniref:MIP18 family-like domain-containing protein n=1 Tax=Secundilactobacillus pentosiphilus TaxID=1714682 RepID=A0A1Z5IW90_9LACO|nr:metal-sulfur cluster assembly factor [Secundilactobacillus pentosiphilus]GAX06033.1 hypothetical protein IWT25_01358 [Secundilactobacillus pentosiphilus]
MQNNSLFKSQALAALRNVIDPELGVDIVNLGLIYDVDLIMSGICHVSMTLTIAGCPMTGYLDHAIKAELMNLTEVEQVEITLVWEPAWSVKKMSRQTRLELGIH